MNVWRDGATKLLQHRQVASQNRERREAAENARSTGVTAPPSRLTVEHATDMHACLSHLTNGSDQECARDSAPQAEGSSGPTLQPKGIWTAGSLHSQGQ